MTSPHDHDPAAADQDLTGVRRLLAELPDPGPMPDAVAERIRASLSTEQALRNGPTRLHPRRGLSMAGAPAEDLAARRTGRGAHLLAAAAAVAGVVLVGGVIAGQLGQGSAWDTVAAIYRDTAGGSDPATAGAADSGEDEEALEEGAQASAEALSGDSGQAEGGQGTAGGAEGDPADEGVLDLPDDAVALPGSVTALTAVPELSSETLAVGAASALDQQEGLPFGPEEAPEQTTGAAPSGAAVDAQTASTCIEATGSDVEDAAWWAGPAVLDGAEAVLVVRRDGARSGPATAWALSPDCLSATSATRPPHVLVGPVELP